MGSKAWKLYDDLIDAVPPDAVISDCLLGWHWSLVKSKTTGVVLSPLERDYGMSMVDRVTGRRAREVAEGIKSWNNIEASLGLAAINSGLNSVEQVETLTGLPVAQQASVPAFEFYADQLRGKKVAVVGHFPGLERLAALCRLSILERLPQPGDLPDTACEYLLPEQDAVFITSTTLVNKTLPRLLELSRGTFVVMVGPSTPLTPVLFEHGVDVLAGSVVVDSDAAWRVAREGGARELWKRGGLMVKVARGSGGSK